MVIWGKCGGDVVMCGGDVVKCGGDVCVCGGDVVKCGGDVGGGSVEVMWEVWR